ncbi:zinc ribbon domain-containing protein [Halodesulfovibrio sp. MK-HDV]|jgi:putative FmdB family regulatory protein|uniref:FmdB family zinc ribbon protein n=1 Tax=unclassified Halodesulfovibrio TaxID=2644657 RepID=UPI00136864B3|nr:zinc ribbon domain-containing protein [Halodesulfovibrio sp. MK-HDV]KAF1074259.1 hypothetical protein MKHDV_02837 [Halodesulfovibrio sp. MK-HDV]
MPLYDYACEACGKEFEELVFGDDTPECPECKSPNTHKLLSATKFKMSGGSISAPTGSSGGSSCSGCSGGNCSTCG